MELSSLATLRSTRVTDMELSTLEYILLHTVTGWHRTSWINTLCDIQQLPE